MRPSRQLAAIMFTDIAGYTALMGSDEVKALEILRHSRNIHKSNIEKYGGRLLKEMGDGILAKFNGALDAVLCAIQIQEDARDLEAKIRIGIHLGDLTVEHEDIFGNSVNIASRLQSVADPGGIFISESIVQAIKSIRNIQYNHIGKVALKHVANPVNTYAVAGAGLPVTSLSRIIELTGEKRLESLVVLPFKNLMGDEQQQFFIDGMHNALIGELSQIKSFRVISRTSSMRYKSDVKSIPEIAAELDVDGIVDASAMKTDDTVLIQAQLIKAFPREKHIWSGTYQKKIKDVLVLYDEVVKDIANKLESELSSFEDQIFNQPEEVNPKAYEIYLRGVFHWEKLTKHDLEKALDYFKQAQAQDSDFALAYSGMAGVWMGRMAMGLVPTEEAIPAAYKNIRKARELSKHIADTYFWNALLMVWVEFDRQYGKREFETALELNPSLALARSYYGHLLVVLGEPSEAMNQFEQAIHLDPFNPLIKALYAMALNFTRQYDRAIEVLQQILSENHNHPVALSTLRSVYHNMQRFEEAFQIFRLSYVEKGDKEAANALDKGYNDGGYHKALSNLAELLISRSQRQYVAPWQIATLYTRAGLADDALKYLDHALRVRDPNSLYLSVDPIFDDLRMDKRFEALLQKVHLPGES